MMTISMVTIVMEEDDAEEVFKEVIRVIMGALQEVSYCVSQYCYRNHDNQCMTIVGGRGLIRCSSECEAMCNKFDDGVQVSVHESITFSSHQVSRKLTVIG